MLRLYPAQMHQDDGAGIDGGFGVVFPDFPGCVSAGESMQQEAAMAADALALHIEGMAEAGLPIPDPSDPRVMPDWLEDAPGRVVVLGGGAGRNSWAFGARECNVR